MVSILYYFIYSQGDGGRFTDFNFNGEQLSQPAKAGLALYGNGPQPLWPGEGGRGELGRVSSGPAHMYMCSSTHMSGGLVLMHVRDGQPLA